MGIENTPQNDKTGHDTTARAGSRAGTDAREFRETLELFNQKAGELRDSRFRDALRSGTSARVTLKVGDTEDEDGTDRVTSEFVGPDWEAIRSATLTLRLFMQNNDGISVRKLLLGYETHAAEHLLHLQAAGVRQQLNAFLDGETPVAIGLEATPAVLTRRELLDAYVYGDLAHLNADQRRIYLALSGSPFSGVIAQSELVHTIAVFVRALGMLAAINDRMLASLR